MTPRRLVAPIWLAPVLALSCGGSDSTPTPDAPPSPGIDAAVVDAPAPGVDGPATTTDAASPPDTTVPGVDATVDASGTCNGVGEPCTTSCPSGLYCYLGGGGGVCAPMRDGCGGFAGATCDDPAAPICMYLTGADYGMCVDTREHDCICAGAPGTVDDC